MLKLDFILQTMNYVDRYQKEKSNWNWKVIGLIKDKLGRKIMTKFVGLRAKTYSYLIDDSSEDKNVKAQKCVMKGKLKFENYKTV